MFARISTVVTITSVFDKSDFYLHHDLAFKSIACCDCHFVNVKEDDNSRLNWSSVVLASSQWSIVNRCLFQIYYPEFTNPSLLKIGKVHL